MIRGGHECWSLAWEVSLASLLAWGWKTHVGLEGYIWIAGAGLGLFKISWGKNLKGTVIFGSLALLMVLLSSGCLQLCCMDRKSALIPKIT